MDFRAHDYQKYCIDKILKINKLALFLEMGLGKTIICLTAISILKQENRINKVLIIAPKTVAEGTWQTEIDKWEHLKNLTYSTVLGTKKQREKALLKDMDIYIINRENVKWLVEYKNKNWDFDCLIIDELTSFKNYSSERFKSLKKVLSKTKRIVGLTGTPISNGYMDLYSQIYLLDQGERLGKNITRYRESYFYPKGGYGNVVYNYELKENADKIIQDKIKDICISMKAEQYISLPPLIQNNFPVVLDNKTLKKYNDFEKDLFIKIKDTEITATSAAILTNKLLQASSGVIYSNDKEPIVLHNKKLEALGELIEQINKRVLIFYSYKTDVERIENYLLSKNKKLRIRKYEGIKEEKEWNEGKIDVLLAHPSSVAYGLNLQQGGNHVIWYTLTYSLEQYKQANARLYRQGQKDKVYIHHLISKNTIDEKVLLVLEKKENLRDLLMKKLNSKNNK